MTLIDVFKHKDVDVLSNQTCSPENKVGVQIESLALSWKVTSMRSSFEPEINPGLEIPD